MLKKPSCHYFNSTGKCRFGKHCRFVHDLKITSNNSAPVSDIKDEAVNQEYISKPDLEVKPHSFRSNTRQQSHESLNSEKFLVAANSSGSNQDLSESKNRDGAINKSNHNKQELSKVRSSDTPICKHYAETRFCRFGNRCRFRHIIKNESEREGDDLKTDNDVGRNEKEMQDEDVGTTTEAVQTENMGSTPVTKDVKRKQSKKVCYFYNQGHCRLGQNCGFFHPGLDSFQRKRNPDKVTTAPKIEKKEVVSDVEKKPTVTVTKTPQITHCYKRDEVSKEQLYELRATEIRQLKRRFISDALRTIEEKEAIAKFVFSFSPSDPDWPFEVTTFDIAVSFTDEYPLQLFSLSVPTDQDLPETVRRYIEVGLEEWVKMKQEQAIRKGTVELLFRPFLRWLDRNMEELVTQALKQYRRELCAKAAGMEFRSAEELRKEYNQSCVEEEIVSKGKDSIEDTPQAEESKAVNLPEPGVSVYRKSDKMDADEVYEVPKRELKKSGGNIMDVDEENHEDENGDEIPKSDNEADDSGHQRPKIDPDTERRGTQLSFKNMQMWYCTTILVEKLRLTIQCERCKNTIDFHTPPNRVNSIICGKCHAVQMVVYRAALAHAYSSTFGFLDLDGCMVFDINMQECHFSMGCIMCQRDVLVKCCNPGKLLEPFCRNCHNKMQFAAESVKTTRLTTEVEQSFFAGKVHKVNSKILKKAEKDPAIQEGKPLPNNGACKHYKKSFRWLRFPCCGKCYPCDECHDDKEDHEMKYANRMICGFCCKEQPYAAEKACTGCNSALTKVHTQHWEGGKGCRNKIAMSRNDDQKYANMNKTVSRKSQQLKEKSKGKKNTKLRHA